MGGLGEAVILGPDTIWRQLLRKRGPHRTQRESELEAKCWRQQEGCCQVTQAQPTEAALFRGHLESVALGNLAA